MKERPRKRSSARAVTAYRTTHGLTQEQLAEQLHVSYRTVQRWEAGDTGVPAAILQLLK